MKNFPEKEILSRKYFFVNRVVHIWNSLPNSVVWAVSLNAFRNRLDDHWKSEEIKYDFERDLSSYRGNNV